MADTTGKKKYNWIKVLLFVVFNVVVIVWTGISELNKEQDNSAKFSELEIKWPFFIVAFFALVIAIAAESFKYKLMMDKLNPGIPYKVSLRVTLMGKYYDNITPSGSGGQPFQIYYLRKNNVDTGTSLTLPIMSFITMQSAFVIIALIVFIFFNGIVQQASVKIMAVVGLICYMIVPIALILFSVAPKAVTKVIAFFMRILNKMKLVKDPDTKEQSLLNTLTEYKTTLRSVIQYKKMLLGVLGLSLIYQVSLMSIPFFILLAFGGSVGWLNIFVTTVYIYAAITVIPTPGNAGAAEASFYMIFSSLPMTGYVFWAMLSWRFLVYYIFIIIGILLTALEYFETKWGSRKIKGK